MERAHQRLARALTLAVAVALALTGLPAAAAHADAGQQSTISGRVVLPLGVDRSQPMRAHLMHPDSDGGSYGTQTELAADGSFSFGYLTDGDGYQLEIEDPSGQVLDGWYLGPDQPLGREGDAQMLVAPVTGLLVTAQAAARISGKVVAPAGVSLAGVSVQATAWESDSFGDGRVAGDGSFSIGGLVPGAEHALWIHDDETGAIAKGYYAGPATPTDEHGSSLVRVAAPATGITIAARPGATVSGSVAFPDGAAPDLAWVQLDSYDETYGAWSQVDSGIVENGAFTISGLVAGRDYRAHLWWEGDTDLVRGYYAGAGLPLVLDGGGALSITAPASGLAVAASRGVSITGRVEVPEGLDVLPDGLLVQAGTRFGDGGWRRARETTVGADGTFSLDGLASGETYQLRVWDSSEVIIEGFYAGAALALVRGPELAADVAAPADDIVLSPARAVTVRGRITLPEGYEAGADQIWVRASPRVAEGVVPEYSVSAMADPDGSFALTGLPAGQELHLQFVDFSGQLPFWYLGDGFPQTVDESAVVVAGEDDALVVPAPPLLLSLTNVTPPVVSGTVQVGATLTASPGTWSQDGVAMSYEWLRDGEPAEVWTSTYPVTAADVGHRLSVVAYARKAGYRLGSATSASTGVVAAGAPLTSTAKPTVSGTAKVGAKLTATAGTWSASGTTAAYQWLRAGTAIEGANASTYVLGAADLGKTVAVTVTASKPGYVTASATSASTAAVTAGSITSTVKPVVTGTAKVGAKLTASAGTWSPSETTPAFQWLRSGVAISGATSSTYTLTATDLGKTLAVKVTASKAGYTSLATTSASTAAVVAGTITSTVKPVVTGTAKVGQKLTASAGTWSATGTTAKYQWLRSGVAISGATAPSYTAALADKGATLAVKVTVSRTGYTTTSATSASTATVGSGVFASTVAPKVTGTAKVGAKLTASAGTWSPAPTTVSYQWLRSGTTITGATGSTYTATAADLGATLSVKVKVALTGYLTASATSAPTAGIAAGTFKSTVAPTVSGTAKVGQKLTASAGTWSPAASTVTYQWLRNGVAIAGATSSFRTATADDKGATLSVQVTVATSGYTSATATSAPSGTVVTGTFTATVAPKVTGTAKVGSTLTAAAGTWTPAATTVTYQWLRGGVAISGATATTYVLTSTDKGKTVSVKVTVSRAGYTTKSATSAAALIA